MLRHGYATSSKISVLHGHARMALYSGLIEITLRYLQLRNNSFPTSLGGKAHDTAVVMVWLQDAMSGMVHGMH